MPTLSAVPLSSLPTAADPGRTVLAATQAARNAASDAFRAASIQLTPGRCTPARAVRSLDLRVEEARDSFETMIASHPVARLARVSAEVDLVREAFGKALAALTTLRCEAASYAPRPVEVRFLSAQVYSAMAHIQATVASIRRKLPS
jgi:hypothetical protein